jgi:peptide/nickel transport system permease protein
MTLLRKVFRPLQSILHSKILRHLFRTPTSVAGIFLLTTFAVIAILAPILAPPQYQSSPYMMPRDSYAHEPSPPSREHLLGTTSGQYDMLYGIVWGTRTAFRIGFVVTAAIAVIGILIGSISAFYGGVVDEVIMRITDVFMTMPFLVAAMVLVTILGQGLGNVMIALVVFGWMGYARVIRGEVKSVRELEYVQAAKALGAGNFRILFRHMLPNAIFPVFVMATMDIGSMVLTAAALSFLGLGSQAGYSDWGQLISFSRDWMLGTATSGGAYWFTVVVPGVTIVLFVLGWNLLGDALRDVLDPRMQGVR